MTEKQQRSPEPEEAIGSSWITRWAPDSLQSNPLWMRLHPWATKLSELFLAQGLLQLLMAASGIVLVRWMPVKEYAIFTLAFAIQSTMGAFVDVGFSSAVVPLVGQRVQSPELVGVYVVAARQLRTRLMPIVLLGGAITFAILGHRQGMPLATVTVLFALAAVTMWFNAVNAVYSAPIVIRQDLRFFHRTQNIAAAARFAAYLVGHAGRWLNSVFAIGLNTFLMIGLASAARRRGRPLIVESSPQSEEVQVARREILRFIAPQIPIMIFNAVEAQVMVLVISIFGKGAALAEVGALMRLNLLFSLTPAILTWVIQPYFSRIDSQLVGRRFWQISAGSFVVLALVPALGFFLPEPFLFILGPKYDHLRVEIGLLLLAGAIGVAAGLISNLCLARRWVFADAIVWVAGFTIGLQALAVVTNDVSLPGGTIAIMILGNVGSLLAYLFLAVRGLRQTCCERKV